MNIPSGFLLTLLGLGLASTSCGAGPTQRTLDPHEQRIAPPITAAVYAVGDLDKLVNGAMRVLISSCMQKRGFTYMATGAVDVRDADVPRPFGLESLAKGSTRDKQAAPVEKAASAAYGRALAGDESARITIIGPGGFTVSRPGNGCLAEAETRLLGNDRRKLTELRLRLNESEENSMSRVYQDKQYRQAQRMWSACMKDAGFDYADPVQIRGKLTDAPLATQAVAKSDVACKEKTGFLGTAYSRLAAAQQAALDQTPGLIEQWKTLLDSQKRAARDVLSSGH